MGSRIAPILAIVALDKLERSTIYNTISCPIPFYQRYVDDSLILLKSNKEAEALLLRMNNSNSNLKFQFEYPTKDNSNCLLDCSITIGGNGEITQGFYEKRAKKPLFIHNQQGMEII